MPGLPTPAIAGAHYTSPDPHPLRTALALIRGAIYLHQQGVDLERCRVLVRHGNERLQRMWDEILKDVERTSEALGDDLLLADLVELRMLRHEWRERSQLRRRMVAPSLPLAADARKLA